jgi:serine/threonine-protein kinase
VVEGGPSVIGRYELHRALASGGMATVYLGRMRSETGLGRTVALKRMHPHFATDPQFVAMFFDEARLAMRLQHPNIVPTFDVVSTEGELLLVMEYIRGESLSGLLRSAYGAGERVPADIASAIVCGVLAGLHAAHEARSEDGAPLEIVHRDVSPQNVMVGADGAARLLDFGVAKAAGRVHSTAQGQIKGKFAYMSPEQLTTEQVDRRADIFAASVLLWETLTGERLFKGETAGALVNAVLSAVIVPPSRVVADLPAGLDAVVMRGLARQKRERFATAREMALALELAQPPATARAVGEWTERLAARALKVRSQLVKDVERAEGAGMVGTAPPTSVTQMSGRDEMPTEAPRAEDVSVVGVGAPATTVVTSRRTLPLGVGIAVGLLGMTTAVIALTRGTAKEGVTAALAAQSASASGAAITSSAPVTSSATAEPSGAAAASATPPPPTLHPPRSRPRANPQKPDCSNPFVVDARGIRVPRPECF